jgi:hypothetical protein
MKNAGELMSGAASWIKITYANISARLVQTWQRIISKPPPESVNGDDPDDLVPVGIRQRNKSLVKPRHKPIRRRSRVKVYRLKGYTTVAKVNRKRQSERQQRLLRRTLVFIIIVLLMILLFNLYNPIKDLTEWYRIIGINDLTDLTKDNPLGTTSQTSAPSTAATVQTTTTSSAAATPAAEN